MKTQIFSASEDYSMELRQKNGRNLKEDGELVFPNRFICHKSFSSSTLWKMWDVWKLVLKDMGWD